MAHDREGGNLLTYSQGRQPGSRPRFRWGRARLTANDVLTSSEQDTAPQVAPSGNRIAFQSWRSGSQEIWTAGLDGSNPVEITDQGASAGSPAWSRDSRLLAFDARPLRFSHIFVMDANGGTPHALTSGPWNDVVPSWSADDRWIYFGSNRSGGWQIWKLSCDGQGPAQQVTEQGGMVARESVDGRWLYFSRFDTLGLWRRPVTGGAEQKIFHGPPSGYQNYWTVAGRSVYALAARNKEFDLVRIDPDNTHTFVIYTMRLGPIPFAGLTVTPDEKQLLFAPLGSAESTITLVDHFR